MNNFLILAKQEIFITLIIFILLFIKVSSLQWSNQQLMWLVNLLLLANLLAGCVGKTDGMLFNEMFHANGLVVAEKAILNGGTLLVSLLAYDWLLEHKYVAEFYILLLSTLLGMFFMISAGNLIMFYLGLELAGIPLAAIINFNLQTRTSSEAAVKFIISSAFSSALLLMGISFVYGSTGTLTFSEIPAHLTGNGLQWLALVLLIAGFAFKISAVPFHLWTADVYEGAPVMVSAYLAVISKGAAVFVLVSVLYAMLKPFAHAWYMILFWVSMATMFVGNLFALRQTNIKRLLAFSSIAQAGFILVGISGSSSAGMASVLYFVLVYTFSNLGAFGVVALVSARTGRETVKSYQGFYKTNPLLAWTMAIALFSLAGVPPAAGFFGKFFLLLAGAGKGNYALIVVAAINMVISLYYYLIIVKTIFIDGEDSIEKIQLHFLPKIALICCLVGMLLPGFFSQFYEYFHSLSNGL